MNEQFDPDFSETDSPEKQQAHFAVFQRDLARIGRQITKATGLADQHRQSPEIKQIYTRQIDHLQKVRDTFRTPTTRDLRYREKLKTEFAKTMRKEKPKDLSLRFHGTSFVTTEYILASGKISSAADHDGFQRSMDISGMFSVTSGENFSVTIRDYIDLKTQSSPIGCVFVLIPKKGEVKSSKNTLSMSNVSLKEGRAPSPQFKALLCSPETINDVKKWLKKHGYPTRLAVEYFEFVDSLENAGS